MGVCAEPWREADSRQAAQWSGGCSSYRRGGGAGAGAFGEAEEGLRVDFALAEGFFCKNIGFARSWPSVCPIGRSGKSR